MSIYRNIILALFVFGFFSSNSVLGNETAKSNLENRITNLQSYDVKTFYDSTLSLFATLNSYHDKEFGKTKSNKLFEIIKSKKGYYGNRLHWIHMEVFTDSAKLNYLNRAEILAKTYNSKTNIAWVNYTKSIYYEQKHIYDKSIIFLLVAKDIYETLEDKKYLSMINQALGNMYFASQQYKDAQDYYKTAYNNLSGSAEFVNERQFILLNNIGYANIRLRNYNLAIKYFNRALNENYKGLPKLQKIRAVSYLYAAISDAYLEDNNIKKAKEFINKALMVSKEEEDYFLASLLCLSWKPTFIIFSFVKNII